jgi:hypothetical protein
MKCGCMSLCGYGSLATWQTIECRPGLHVGLPMRIGDRQDPRTMTVARFANSTSTHHSAAPELTFPALTMAQDAQVGPGDNPPR